jgi:AhpD family alkylhydroperoxidase
VSALQQVDWEECLVEPGHDAALDAQLRRELGFVPPWTRYFTACPWIVRGTIHTDHLRGRLAHLSLELAEWLILVVSQDNSCRYCFASHRLILRVLGTPEERILQLEQDAFAPDVPARERAAFDFARRFSRANPLATRADLEGLEAAGWNAGAAREIALVAGLGTFVNRISTLPALPPQGIERLPDRWFMRLVMPAARLRLRRAWRPGPALRLTPEQRRGPFAELVCAFDGLPLAAGLRSTIDEAWASPRTSRRLKGLVFAVVARAVGDPLCEGEAARLLAAEGLSAAQLEEVLAHLGSPFLDAAESDVVAFARETVRYRPAAVQRRARALRQHFEPAPLLEVLGTAAMANMLSRLGAVVSG